MAQLIASFADSEVKVRYKEPYLTAGLNEKDFAVIPRGIYRGFRLTSNATNNLLTVQADPDTTDHVLIFETSTGYSIKIRKTGGDFTLDFTGLLDSTEYIVAVFASYVLNATTYAEIRAYTQAEYDAAPEKEQLIVLGTGTTGTLPSLITPAATYRDYAWEHEAEGARRWELIVPSGGFERFPDGTITSDSNLPGVWSEDLTTALTWEIDSTGSPHSGTRELKITGTGVTGSTLAHLTPFVPVEPGVFIDVSYWVRGSSWPSLAGLAHQGVFVQFYDEALSFLSVSYVEDLTLSGTFSYTQLEDMLEAPSGAYFMRAGLTVGSNTTLITGSLYFDDIVVFVETDASKGPRQALAGAAIQPPAVPSTSLLLGRWDSSTLTALINKLVSLSHRGTTGTDEIIQTKVEDDSNFILRLLNGKLDFTGRISNAAENAVARISGVAPANTSGEFTLLWEIDNSLEGRGWMRMYVEAEGGFTFTYNAKWNGTNWERDTVSEESVRMDLDRTSFAVYIHLNSAASPWADSDWDNNAGDTGRLMFRSRYDSLHNRGSIDIPGLVDDLGSYMIGNATQAANARIHAPFPDQGVVGSAYTLLLHLDNESGEGDLRLYISDGITGGVDASAVQLVITLNARWTGTQWAYDYSTSAAHRLTLVSTGCRSYVKIPSGTSPWNDADWADDTESYKLLEYGVFLQGQGLATLQGRIAQTLPSASDQTENMLEGARQTYETGDPTISDFTLVREGKIWSGTAPKWREYLQIRTTGATIHYTWNARYDYNGGTAQWYSDVATEESYRISIQHDGDINTYLHGATASAWTAWDTTPFYMRSFLTDRSRAYFNDGDINFPNATSSLSNRENPGSDNVLMAANTPKAWAHFSLVTGSITLLGEYGVASVSINGGDSTILDITLDRGILDSAICAVGNAETSGVLTNLKATGVTTLEMTAYNTSGSGAAIDFAAHTGKYSFIVFGRQPD